MKPKYLPPAANGSVTDQLIFDSGMSLKRADVDRLEHQLELDATDLCARLQLLAFYFKEMNFFESGDAAQARQKHLLWMIQNRPTDWMCSSPALSFKPRKYRKLYSEAKERWLAQSKQSPDAIILANAGLFLFRWEKDKRAAKEIFQQACSLAGTDANFEIRFGCYKSLFEENAALRLYKTCQ